MNYFMATFAIASFQDLVVNSHHLPEGDGAAVEEGAEGAARVLKVLHPGTKHQDSLTTEAEGVDSVEGTFPSINIVCLLFRSNSLFDVYDLYQSK